MPLAKVGGKHGETSRAVEATETAEGRQPQLAPARVAIPPAKVAAIAAERYLLSVTLAKSTYDNLRYAQELLSHRISFGDVAQVLDRALQALVRQLEKQKFAATEKPRPPRRSANARHIPAHVRREAKKRDDGRCTFVSETGHRCEERSLLEFDHIEPVGRGGKATVENVRLRCRAHNQYEAERTFGVEFMREKRAQAFEARQTRS